MAAVVTTSSPLVMVMTSSMAMQETICWMAAVVTTHSKVEQAVTRLSPQQEMTSSMDIQIQLET